jgi:hypothetical protein
MYQISKGEIWSILYLLRELRDGAEVEDLEQDVLDMIEMLEDILKNAKGA